MNINIHWVCLQQAGDAYLCNSGAFKLDSNCWLNFCWGIYRWSEAALQYCWIFGVSAMLIDTRFLGLHRDWRLGNCRLGLWQTSLPMGVVLRWDKQDWNRPPSNQHLWYQNGTGRLESSANVGCVLFQNTLEICTAFICLYRIITFPVCS